MMETEAETSTLTYRIDDQTRPSTAVAFAVSELVGDDPASLPETLHEAVDPDALDDLFADSQCEPGTVSFTFNGCRVQVDGTDEVLVSELPESR